MTISELDATLKQYERAIETIKRLKASESAIEIEQVITILNARNDVQLALQELKRVPTNRLQLVIELDDALRELATEITKVIKTEQWTKLRSSVHPRGDAWWWKLDPPLQGTKAEAETIALQLKVKPLLGKAATEGVVKQIQAPKILHIATHGFFKNKRQTQENQPNQSNQKTINDNPLLLSGLVFAGFKQQQSGGENGILSALETSTLNLLGTKLVVLSACDTGLGRITDGEGIYNLRRALVIAGSESQVISLWQVEDNGTKDLMKDYYQRLLDSTTKTGRSEALRQTQLKMLRGEMIQGEKYQHPYYWAAFIPSGEWKSMEE